jgi:hypothetical protein|tara:strand:- start:544 stop:783 length:240 start_codon:yes stop_codon:yes gene_type:complete
MDIIRKIVIGQNPKDAMAYFVGQRAGGAIVDSIVLDERVFAKHGIRRYLVYLFDTEKGITLWKTIDDMPCLIEHDCDFE